MLLCANDTHPGERTEEKIGSRGLNEGPEVLRHSGRTFLTDSCGASWTRTSMISGASSVFCIQIAAIDSRNITGVGASSDFAQSRVRWRDQSLRLSGSMSV